MTTVADLLVDPERRRYASMPEMDALTEPGALQEAALVALRSDLIHATVALLFDLRGALHYMDGNVAVVVVVGVEAVEWTSDPSASPPRWWAVIDSLPEASNGRFRFSLGFVPAAANLRVDGTGAEFYVGRMPGMDDPPPDFTEASEREIHAGMPSWEKKFAPAAAVFLDPPVTRT